MAFAAVGAFLATYGTAIVGTAVVAASANSIVESRKAGKSASKGRKLSATAKEEARVKSEKNAQFMKSEADKKRRKRKADVGRNTTNTTPVLGTSDKADTVRNTLTGQ